MGRIVQVESGVPGLTLFDMYIGSVWHGSRRTREFCIAYFKQHNITEIEDG